MHAGVSNHLSCYSGNFPDSQSSEVLSHVAPINHIAFASVIDLLVLTLLYPPRIHLRPATYNEVLYDGVQPPDRVIHKQTK
jgi:hypothetical protein